MTEHRVASNIGQGLTWSWGAEHRDRHGNLISRQASIDPPAPPTCIRPGCLWRYVLRTILYTLIASYHARRVAYAEAHYYVAESVDGKWMVRRAGINPVTGSKYPYEKRSYTTQEAAIKETTRIFNRVSEKYRAGEHSPKTIWQAICANAKLACPIFRECGGLPLLGRTT